MLHHFGFWDPIKVWGFFLHFYNTLRFWSASPCGPRRSASSPLPWTSASLRCPRGMHQRMVFLRAVHHWVFLFAWFFGSSPPWGFLELFTVCFFGIPLRFCLGFFSWNATTPSIFGVLHRCCGGVLHHCHPGEVLHCACLEECINISLFVSPSPFVFWELSTLGAFWEVSSLRVLRILQPKAFWECSSLLVF